MKAIALLSGGLDSRLAIKLLQKQGIELEALNFNTIFCTCTSKHKSCSEAVEAARESNVPLTVYNTTKEVMAVVENPKFGYGRGMNPCLDCRIAVFKKAKEHMIKVGASFIVTGEVLGQRPMSQRPDAIQRIEKESGLEGLILRPLSAKLFKPTIPEINGWVKRDSLLDITGRSRKVQIELAKELGVNDYPCPAGGCLLTEKAFSKKIKDLIDHKQWDLENATLLTLGRHFRISKNCKAIVGRDEKENERLCSVKKDNDALFRVESHAGPVTLVKGKPSAKDEQVIAGIAASYVNKKKGKGNIKIGLDSAGAKKTLDVAPLSTEEVIGYRITK